ncbi:MAG: radical SAM protein [Bacteroidales bacterium]
MTIQWHINENCNLRCKHCYQDAYQNEGFSLNDLILILDKIQLFIENRKEISSSVKKAHINFTGGEPFLKKEIIELLTEVNNRKIFSFGILSNGFLLNETELKSLKELQPKFIQISLDGNRSLNDSIRGNGSFEAIVLALKTYHKLKIPCMISFTVNSTNYKTFPEVVSIARKYKTFKVWTDRYIPENIKDPLILQTNQFKEFMEIVLHEQSKTKYHFLSKTKITSNRALQFLVSGGQPYKCSAADQLLAIMANGDVMPCRRLPFKMGNILNQELSEIYNHPIKEKIHCLNSVIKDCELCYYKKMCNGGLRCLTYAISGDLDNKDPDCWI